jgi:hypothetical protein
MSINNKYIRKIYEGNWEADRYHGKGKLFDPRAFLGRGSYIDSSEDLINTLVPKFRAFPPYKEK